MARRQRVPIARMIEKSAARFLNTIPPARILDKDAATPLGSRDTRRSRSGRLSPSASEIEFQRELNDARRSRRGTDHSEGRRLDQRGWIHDMWVCEKMKKLSTKFEIPSLVGANRRAF